MTMHDRYVRPSVAIAATLYGVAALTGCGADFGPYAPPRPGAGVIFTYPFDGQRDVPTGTTIVVTFTDPVARDVVARSCSLVDGVVSGGFCVRGPSGLVAPDGPIEVTGARDNVIRFTSHALESGAVYEVIGSPALLEGGAENLHDGEPLLRFTTRSEQTIAGQDATIIAINGDDPGVYRAGATAEPRFPFLDFSTLRLVFSEPIDPVTVIAGSTIDLIEVDPSTGAQRAVSGTWLVQGIHASFDPDTDLVPGTTYELRVRAGIRDLGGEPVEAGEYELVPADTRIDGAVVEQVLAVRSAADGAPSIAGIAANTVSMSHPLLGTAQLAARESAVVGQIGNAEAFGGMIPIAIRKGQLVRMDGLAVALGGVVPAGLDTGELAVRFVSDASGFLMRNPYRDPGQVPDDATSPVFLYLTFDIAMTAADPVGNAVLDQTVMNVQATGVGTIAGNALAIETVGAIELDLLGAARAPAQLALRMETTRDVEPPSDRDEPRLVAAYPANGQLTAAVDDLVLLTFSEPLAPASAAAISVARTSDGQPIASDITTSGSTVIVKPRALLAYGTSYTVTIGTELVDIVGNPIVFESGDPTAGTRTLGFATPALAATTAATNQGPVLTALYPGVPCALTGATTDSPGRCAGGLAGDSLYRPFVMPADRHVEGYFNQPINPATLVLGGTCGTGSVRIEALDSAGACTAAVTGTLQVTERGFRFVPAQPWGAGQAYRLTLVAGPNATCAAGEICGKNGKPLNTDPLDGTRANADPTRDKAGGPDIVIPFTAAPASRDTYLASIASPVADINGNGLLDVGETAHDTNRGVSKITGFTGSVTQARIPADSDCVPGTTQAEGCLHVNAVLPVSIAGPSDDCTIGVDAGGNPIVVPQCVAVDIAPQILYGTALRLEATIVDGNGDPNTTNKSTGQLVLRVRENLDAPSRGYIYSDPATGEPRFAAKLSLYMDAPDLIIIGAVQHDLHSKPLEVTATGPVTFTADGRIQIAAANENVIDLTVHISDPTDPQVAGTIAIQIPRDEMKLQLVSGQRRAALLSRGH